jgi:hypothetical protein
LALSIVCDVLRYKFSEGTANGKAGLSGDRCFAVVNAPRRRSFRGALAKKISAEVLSAACHDENFHGSTRLNFQIAQPEIVATPWRLPTQPKTAPRLPSITGRAMAPMTRFGAALNELGPICPAAPGLLDGQFDWPVAELASRYTIIIRYATPERCLRICEEGNLHVG